MNVARMALFTCVGLLVVAAAGCRSCGDTELLERELRIQEDEIYRLKALLNNAPSVSSSSNVVMPPAGLDKPAASELRPPEVELPDVELPPGLDKPAPQNRSQKPPLDRTMREEAPRFQQQPTRRARKSSDPRVRYVTLDRARTGGQANGGLRVVLEPRNANGDVVATPGQVSVVILDPAYSGPQARVARWDFGTADIHTLMSVSRGQGVELDLDWPDGEPRHNKLNLYVRYRTPDGQELRAESMISADGSRTAWDTAPSPSPRRAQPTRRPTPTPAPRAARSQADLARREAPARSVRSVPQPEPVPQFILHGDREDPRNPVSSPPRVRIPR